ncbi:MAG: hypothetical protein H7X93_00470 [Sphingomonadaceae bacterium]|nr:hypothetical protein [Sphingomonadaceae bacterium]
MSQIIDAYSRYIVIDAAAQANFTFTFQYESGLSEIVVYKNGDRLVQGVGYTLNSQTKLVTFTPALVKGDSIEIVRVTAPPADGTPLSPLQILFMVQEAVDKQVFMNGHGLPLMIGGTVSDSALLTNEFQTADNPPVIKKLPTVQALPDGGLATDQEGENPAGFNQAAFRTQHRFPGTLEAVSHPMWWFSGVIENPSSPTIQEHNYSFYGLKVTLMGFQEGRDGYHMANSAINVISTTAAGVAVGDSQGIVCEARHNTIQSTLTWPIPPAGDIDSRLIFTAQGAEATRGEDGDDVRVKIVTTTGTNISVSDLDITIESGGTGSNSAIQVAGRVNAHAEAKMLVKAEWSGNGNGTVVDTGGNFVNLMDGENCNGRLVGNQTITRPQGIDHGPGYVNSSGQLILAHPDAQEDYAYAANSNGFYPGFSAYIAKSKTEPNDPFEQGWQNAFSADDKSIKARLLWLYKYVTIEVPGFYLNKGTEEDPDIRAHDSVWMGLGTDEPASPLHLRTWGEDKAELRLENTAPWEEGEDSEFARILFDGRGLGDDIKTMASIESWVYHPEADNEAAEIVFKTRSADYLSYRMHLGKGLWLADVSGGDQGPGSVNATSLHVGGTKVLEADSVTGNGAKVILGPSANEAIDGSGAIPFRRTNMTVTGASGSAELKTITGGEEGAWLIIRPSSTSVAITVKDNASGGNIRCGTDITLGNQRKTMMLLYSGTEWLRVPTV